jgi:hypothetical protein
MTAFTFVDIKNCLDDTIGHPKADTWIPNPFKTKWKHVFPPFFLNLCELRVLGANKYFSKKTQPKIRLQGLPI